MRIEGYTATDLAKKYGSVRIAVFSQIETQFSQYTDIQVGVYIQADWANGESANFSYCDMT